MRLLGIDYGAKRIGLAISDELAKLAFPKEIIPNDQNVFEKIESILQKENIQRIVIGESLDFAGVPNKVAKDASKFTQLLKEKFQIEVETEKEFLTTVEARRYQDGEVDSSAAALILQ